MATSKGSSRKSQSICEKSAAIAVNLVRASSFALSSMTLGLPSAGRSGGRAPIEESPVKPPVLRRDPTSIITMQRVPGSHPTAYVEEPDGGKSVDERAAEYILKFKEKNRSDPREVAEDSNRIPPPPSRKRSTAISNAPN